MSKAKLPKLTVEYRTLPHPGLIIHRGELATLKVKVHEAIDLANQLVDIIEEVKTDDPATMRDMR